MMNSVTKLNIFSKYSNNIKKNLSEKAWKIKQFDTKLLNKTMSESISHPSKVSTTFYFSKMQNVGNANRRLLFKTLEKKAQQKQQISFMMQKLKSFNSVQYQQKQFKKLFTNTQQVNRASSRLADKFNKISIIQQMNQFFRKSTSTGSQMMKFKRTPKIDNFISLKIRQQFQQLTGKLKYPSYAAAFLTFFYSQAAFSRDFFDFTLKQENVMNKLEANQDIAEFLGSLNTVQKGQLYTALINLDGENLLAVTKNKEKAQIIAITFLNNFTPCNRPCKFGPGAEDDKKALPSIQKKAASDEETTNTYLQKVIDYLGIGAAFGAGTSGAGAIIGMGLGITVTAAVNLFIVGTVISAAGFATYAHNSYTKHEKLLQDLCDDYLKKFLNKLEIKRI